MSEGFLPGGGVPWILKDPSAKLAYARDWSPWLESGDSVASAAWSVSPEGELAINADKSAIVGAVAHVFLEGGVDGRDYTLTCHVVTTNGLEDDRSFVVRVRER
jgi:hypothetical protein